MNAFLDDLRAAVRGSDDAGDLGGELPQEYVKAAIQLILSNFVGGESVPSHAALELRVRELHEKLDLDDGCLQVAENRILDHLSVIALQERRAEWAPLLGVPADARIKPPSSE